MTISENESNFKKTKRKISKTPLTWLGIQLEIDGSEGVSGLHRANALTRCSLFGFLGNSLIYFILAFTHDSCFDYAFRLENFQANWNVKTNSNPENPLNFGSAGEKPCEKRCSQGR